MKHLIFLHLPKNGGKTINSILNRIYRKEKLFQVKWEGTKGNLDDFHNMSSDERNKIKLLKGHFNFGQHQYFNGETSYFTFVRRPKARIISYYNYLKQNPLNRLYKEVVEGGMSIAEFIKMDDIDGNNGQVRKLSGKIDLDEVAMFNSAKENISNYFPVIGIQEYFDESLIVLAHYYKWPIPYYIKENVTNSNKINLSKAEEQLLESRNKEDSELYEMLLSKLKKQIKEVPYFKLKLVYLRALNYLIKNPLVRFILGRPQIS